MKRSKEHSKVPSSVEDSTLWRWLYLPWGWGVFMPFLAVTTLGWGTTAIVVARFSRHLAFHCGTAWAWSLCRVNWTGVKVRGREHLAEGQSYIIMSNHQSHFDSLAIYGHWFRQFRWVMKQELRHVPALGQACADIGHIFVDRSDREKAIASLRAAKDQLEPGVSILFFPEGSRSMDGRLGELKKGGFVMAQQMGLPILPISITGSYRVLPARSVMPLPGSIRITIHPPIDPARYGEDERELLMADVRAAIASGLPLGER